MFLLPSLRDWVLISTLSLFDGKELLEDGYSLGCQTFRAVQLGTPSDASLRRTSLHSFNTINTPSQTTMRAWRHLLQYQQSRYHRQSSPVKHTNLPEAKRLLSNRLQTHSSLQLPSQNKIRNMFIPDVHKLNSTHVKNNKPTDILRPRSKEQTVLSWTQNPPRIRDQP